MKGWQCSRPIPGSDDVVESWFSHEYQRQFLAWLDCDRECYPELDSTVVWVGF